MKSEKKASAAVGFIFSAAVIFFIAIILCSVVLDDGSTETPEIDPYISISDMRVDVVWEKDRSCKITQNIAVEFNAYRHGIYVDIPVNSGEQVRGLDVAARDSRGDDVNYELSFESRNRIVRIKVGEEGTTYRNGEKLYCTVKYDYLTPVHPDGKNYLDINAIGYGWTCYIKNAAVSVTYPYAPDLGAQVWVSGEGYSDVVTSNGGRTVTISDISLSPFKGVRVKAEMPSGILISRSSFEGVWTAVVGGALLAVVIILMVFLGKDKPVTPVINFYPPYITTSNGARRRMLPVQMGKIIDGKCSSNDVTSLIFYWASEGYLRIDDTDSETYLVKLKELDEVTHYEKTMFDALFKGKKPGKKSGEIKVSLSSLSGKFAQNITEVKADVNAEYRGAYYRGGYTFLSFAAMLCVALFAFFNAVLSSFRVASGFYNVLGAVTLIPIALAYAFGRVINSYYHKLTDKKRMAFLLMFFGAVILLSVAVMLFIPTSVMDWMEKSIFGVCIGASAALCPFLTRRTDKYTESLNEILGFRNFIRDAEKEKLEMLLKDDPQYYYGILPYANVLGVSDIWENKFKDMQIEPPTYYRGSHASIFDIYVLSRVSHSIGNSLTYTPPKVSSGSFSGGGGHSSGGGGSFGGFGGGGGGSW